MIFKKSFFLLVFLNFLFFSSYSVQVNVNISEDSKITKLLSGVYSLEANGKIEIYNPSNFSKIYEFKFPLKLDSLIGISKRDIDNSSNKFDFSYERIKGYLIEPNETIRVGYHIYGMLNEDLYTKLEVNESVFEYYSDFDFIPKVILNLQKPERDGIDYDNNGTTISFDGSNSSKRLISAYVRNPTDFELYGEKINLYATTSGDPMFRNSNLLTTFQNISISPFGFKEFDYFDKYSINNSVYWLSSEINVIPLIKSNLNRNLVIQKPESSGKGGKGSSGGSYTRPNNEVDFSNALLIKKAADKTLIRSGDEFNVFLTIVNVKNFIFENLTIFDELPVGYDIKEVSSQVKINDRKLEFKLDKIEEYSSITISYTLINKEKFSGIAYLKPAELVYLDYNIFSDGILIINDLLPDKKVFVQKKVDIIDETFSKVTLKVKNLGSIKLEDLLISDDIPEEVIIKEISKVFFERGSWKINTLDPGDEWEVSYLVERNPSIDNLPSVFGVDQENVYGTLVSSGEVITIFKEEPRTIEKIGLFVSVGLLIAYLLF